MTYRQWSVIKQFITLNWLPDALAGWKGETITLSLHSTLGEDPQFWKGLKNLKLSTRSANLHNISVTRF